MAYYYLTSEGDIYKSVGARKVKQIHSHIIKFKIPQTVKDLLPRIAIPMIRRVFPQLITNELVNVQPMSAPVGLGFVLKHRYGEFNAPAGFNRDGGFRPDKKYPRRNIFPLFRFKSKNTIICESKNFYDIIFEMATNNLCV